MKKCSESNLPDFCLNFEQLTVSGWDHSGTLVGLIELVSEFAKILSFGFRLLGNIFAGQVLLFVIGFLAPVALVAVYGLEFFVGAIQAMVFAMLTLTFMSGATVSHHHGDDDEHH